MVNLFSRPINQAVEINHSKAQAVVAGTWIPSEVDKVRAKVKADTSRRRVKEQKAAKKMDRRESRRAAREAKRGKVSN